MGMKHSNYSRDIFAKLLAEENILIEHDPTLKTAGWDVKSRRLLLPEWDKCSNDLYNLMISHEVSHALHTPSDGWEKIVKEDPKLASVANVVEDVRIEKMIINKYPGLRTAYKKGYQQLWDKKFFQCQDTDDLGHTTIKKDLGLINELNLYFKVKRHTDINIPLSSATKEWIDRLDSCETFAEVVACARELYEAWKEQQEEQKNQEGEEGQELLSQEGQEQSQASQGQGEQGEGLEEQGEEKGAQQTSGSDDLEDIGDSEERTFSKSQAADDSEDDTSSNKSGSDETDDSGDDDLGDPCSTQKSLDENMTEMSEGYDYSARTSIVYFPDHIRANDFIVGHKQLHGILTESFNAMDSSLRPLFQKFVNEYKADSKRAVNYMAKEFEQRKAAQIAARVKTSKTGVINTNKLHSYKFNDDLFLRVTQVPQGKNHGLVIIFDMSGSMSEQMVGSIQQLFNLVWFCRRVQIPFRVYGFSDNSRVTKHVKSMDSYMVQDNEIYLQDFALLEFLSDDMTARQISEAEVNLMGLLVAYSDYYWNNGVRPYSHRLTGDLGRTLRVPEGFELGCTPLDASLVVMPEIINDFRQSSGIDIVNFITLTDGRSNTGVSVKGTGGSYSCCDRGFADDTASRFIFVDKKNRRQYADVGEGCTYRSATNLLLQRVKEQSNVNVIGFHIVTHPKYAFSVNRSLARYKLNGEASESVSEYQWNNMSAIKKRVKKEGYDLIENAGAYDQHFAVLASSLLTENAQLKINENMTRGQMAKAFNKFSKNDAAQRIMLRKFITKISGQQI